MKKLSCLFIIITNILLADPALDRILALPEGKSLFEELGPVTIQYTECEGYPYDAHWDGDNRVITINTLKRPTESNAIQSIIFEMFNARDNKELHQYFFDGKRGLLSKEEFVVAVEMMEYEHMLEAAALIRKGIDEGLFPPETALPIIHEFDTYYKIQQLTGHSQWIAERYDDMTPQKKRVEYRGTIDITNFSAQDRLDMAFYLGVRDHIKNDGSKKEKYLARVQKDYAKSERKAELIDIVFNQTIY